MFVIFLIVLVELIVPCMGQQLVSDQLFKRIYIDSDDWTSSTWTYSFSKIECAAVCKAEDNCDMFIFDAQTGSCQMMLEDSCNRIMELENPTGTGLAVYTKHSDQGPGSPVDILIHQPERKNNYTKIVRLHPDLPGTSGPACLQGSLDMKADHAGFSVTTSEKLNIHKRKSDGKLLICPRVFSTELATYPNNRCFATSGGNSTVISDNIGKFVKDMNSALNFVDIPGDRIWVVGNFVNNHKETIILPKELPESTTAEFVFNGPILPIDFRDHSDNYRDSHCFFPYNNSTVIVHHDKPGEELHHIYYNWQKEAFENGQTGVFYVPTGKEPPRCAKVIWQDGKDKIIYMLGSAQVDLLGTTILMLDLESDSWTQYDFPNKLEPGIEFNPIYCGFTSDGLVLYYYEPRTNAIYTYKPIEDVDNQGIWKKHSLAELLILDQAKLPIQLTIL